MDNERDSLCAFHLRIATFDSGWANAAAEQEAPPTKDGGINPKGWCAVHSICESRLSIRVGQMQRRSERLRLQRMVESTPKAGAIN